MVDTKGSRLDQYSNFVQRRKWWIIGAWLVLVAAAAYPAIGFLGATTTRFTAPGNTQAARDTAVLDQFFPSMSTNQNLIMLVTAATPAAFDLDAVATLFVQVEAACKPYLASGFLESFDSYPKLMAQNLSDIATQFVAPAATFASLSVQGTDANAVLDFLDFVEGKARHLGIPAGHTLRMTGFPVFTRDSQRATESDLTLMDSFGLPCALLVMAYVLKSIRFVVLPVLALGAAVACAFACMYFVATYLLDVISFVPSTMLSVTLALTIDYNLFLLSRSREEILKNGRPADAGMLTEVLRSAGHTIAVSGGTLCVCFLGLCAFPLAMLQSAGLGAALSIIWILLINLSLSPAILMAFPSFFASPFLLPVSFTERALQVWHFITCKSKNAKKPTPSSPAEPGSLTPSRARAVGADSALVISMWYKLTRFLLRRGILVILLVCGAVAPLAVYAFGFKQSISMSLITPASAESAIAFADLSDTFSPGAVTPYSLLMVPSNASQSIFSEGFITASGNMCVDFVENVPYVSPSRAVGLVCTNFTTGFTATPWPVIDIIFSNPDKPCSAFFSPLDTLCPYLRVGRERYVSPGAGATVVSLAIDTDPFGMPGRHWLSTARDFINAHGSKYPELHAYIVAGAAEEIDGVNAVYDVFPVMIAVTCTVVMVMIAVAFKSIMFALRMVATVCVTLLFSYGFAAQVYQYGALDFLGFEGFKSYGALCWFAPLMSFSVVVGLALDYDLFSSSRVTQFRVGGMSHRLALIKGQFLTGRIVTAAGLIMAISFGCLLFSAQPVLCQLGFFLSMSVLFDTFIVRTLLVPSMMGLLGSMNWWPRKLPPVRPGDINGVPESQLGLSPRFLCLGGDNEETAATTVPLLATAAV